MGETVKNKDAEKATSPKPDERELDQELADTFPASDPPSSTQRDEREDKPRGGGA